MCAFASYEDSFFFAQNLELRSLFIRCTIFSSFHSLCFPSRFHLIFFSSFLHPSPFAFFVTHSPPLLFVSPYHPKLLHLFPSFLSSFLPSPSPLPYPPSLFPLSFNLSSSLVSASASASSPSFSITLHPTHLFLPSSFHSLSHSFASFPLWGIHKKANMDTPGRKRGIISSKYFQSTFISKCTKFSSSTLQGETGLVGMGIDFLFLTFLYSISFISFPSSSSSSFPLLPFFLPFISFSSAIPSLPLLTSPRFLYRLFPLPPPPPLRYLYLSFPFLSIPFSFLRLLLSMVRTCKWTKYPDLPIRFLFAPHSASNCSPKHPGTYPN